MNLNEFSQRLEERLPRIATLLQRNNQLPDEQQELLAEALEELSIVSEELQVAQEELLQQNEALAQQNEALAQQNEALQVARISAEAERQRYQELFEFAPDGYLITDAEGLIKEANRAAGDLFLLSESSLIGSSLFDWVAAPDRSALESQLPLDSHIDWIRELEISLQPHKRWRVDVAVKVAVVRNSAGASAKGDRSGKVVGLRWLLRDITDRKRLEAERERLYQEARETNRIKGEFLAIVSHELRTPLNAIVGWAQMLRNRKLNEATSAKALETIERNAKLQGKLIEDILDISRIVQGKIRLNMLPVHLVPVVNAVIENVRPIAESQGIQLESILDPEVGRVMGDSERLQQVVWNLLSNAVKFTPKGGRVAVRLESVDSMAQLTVQDTGKGISADFLPYVFERFRQADGTTTRLHGGLGLGLAIVRYLVEMHNGTVYAASDGEGKGATFTVRLPLIDSQEVYPTEENEVVLANLPALVGLRVLVVDDNTDNLELIAFVFKQGKAQVTTAASAGEALNAIASQIPDILICDIGMPEEDGYALIRKVRTLEADRGGQIPAIALTAFARDEERALALDSGFQMHVAKPVDPASLVAVIVQLIGGANKNNTLL